MLKEGIAVSPFACIQQTQAASSRALTHTSGARRTCTRTGITTSAAFKPPRRVKATTTSLKSTSWPTVAGPSSQMESP